MLISFWSRLEKTKSSNELPWTCIVYPIMTNILCDDNLVININSTFRNFEEPALYASPSAAGIPRERAHARLRNRNLQRGRHPGESDTAHATARASGGLSDMND